METLGFGSASRWPGPPLPPQPPEKKEETLSSWATWSMRLHRAGPFVARLSLALVFFWFGLTQLYSPEGWVSYLPQFLTDLDVNPTFFIFLNGTFEVLLSVFLFLGVFVRPAAFLLGVHLFGITISFGLTPIGVRDFGLSLAMIAVSFYGDDFYTLSEFLKRKKFLERNKIFPYLYYGLLSILALVLFIFSFYTYLTATRAAEAAKLAAGTSATGASTINLSPGEVLSLDILAKHNTKEDCWLLISDKVYNVTAYIPVHPGGVNQIVNNCGKESTTAFNTKGGIGSKHSSYANDLLRGYYLGDFGKAITPVESGPGGESSPKGATTTTSTTTSNVPPKKATLPTTPTTKITVVSTGITLAALATHKSQSNCWLLISGKVYNVTDYIPVHPGGTNQIVNNCGKESTTAFNTKGGAGNDHSSYAKTLLAKYYVGNLSGSTAPNVVNNQIQTDTTGPTASFFGLTSGGSISGTTGITISASDTSGIASVRFSVDGVFASSDTTTPFTLSLVTTNYSEGAHTITALVTDTKGNTTTKTISLVVANQTQNQNTTATLTLATVATHNSQSNCWLLINNKIYDVTAYIPVHPGGVNQIVNNCGKESTTAFNTKGGGGGSHSTNANNLLAGYFIGNLVVTAQTDTTAPAVSFTLPASGATLSGTATISVTASDASGVLSVRFSIDGNVLITNMSTPYSYSLVTTNYGNGAHTLTALATDTSGNTSTATRSVTITNQITATLNMAEIATHNTQSNCWLLINNKVYNVTAYIDVHPGGVNQIVNNCGTEATTAFNTKGGSGNSHSTNANNLLAGYYLGDLVVTAQTDTTAPTVSFTLPASGATLSGTASITASASDTGGMASVRFSIDSTVISTDTTSPYSASLLTTSYTNGAHTLTALATDTSGNTSSATRSVTITNQITVTLDMAEIATHNIQSNCWLLINNKVYNVTAYIPVHPGGTNQIVNNCGKESTTAFNTKGGGGGSHSTNANNLLAGYYLGDLVGGTGTQTDTTAPTVSFTLPASGATLSGTASITASASDTGGMASVRFSIDSTVISTDTTSPYSASLLTTSYTNGAHTLTALATDTSGNTSSATRSVTISNTGTDTTAPTVSFTLPASGATLSGTASITASASDTGGMASVRFSIDSTVISTDTTSPYSASLLTTSYTNGAHTLTALATDTSGNTSSATRSVTISNTVGGGATTYPVTVTSAGVIDPASLNINVGDTVTFTYINPGNQITLRFTPTPPNSMQFDSEVLTRSYTFTQTGTYSYHRSSGGITQATIVVGGTGTQTDTTAPTVSFTLPASGATLSGTASITASASDTGGMASVRFSIDSTVISTDTTSPYSASLLTTSYTNGAHTLTALATDTSGNTSSATRSVTISNTVGGTTYTLTEIATHNTQSNCWLLINNKVYNVTAYIPVHPGGTNQIVNNCGKESTTAFNTKGGRGSSHSTSANNLLAGYYIGDLI